MEGPAVSKFGWVFRAALDYLDHDDVRAALLQLQSVVSQYHACEEAEISCRILTLGRFIVIKNDEAISLTGNPQRVPLELLKVILALGGSSVSVQAISDVMWPDADGDAAHASFKVALHRLRRLLGSPRALIVAHGSVSINEEEVWVDAWAFERWFNSLRGGQIEKTATAEAACMRTLRLYKGLFLGSSAPTIAHPCRERLRSKFIRAVLMLGCECEQQLAWKKAVELYERGIEADALAEDIYARLMFCYGQLGQTARAVDTYRRCRTTLDACLDTMPRMKTQTLYASLRGEGATSWASTQG
jgi:LuxR family transcriptional regulator, maltose regulon positive regulatory protein